MIIKKLVNVLLFLVCLLGYSQNTPESRKGKVLIDIGLDYRITPVYSGTGFSVIENQGAALVDIDLQNSGLGLHFGVEFFVGKNLSLKLSNTFRYDYIVQGQANSLLAISAAPNTYGLLLDYHFSAQYYLKVFNKGDVFICAGLSRLNTNSDFSLKETFFNENGLEIGSIISNENFSYWGSRFELGYSTDRSSIGAGLLMSSTTNFFEETTSFIVPFVKLNIKLFKL